MNLIPVDYKDKEKEFMSYWKNNSDETMYVGFECIKPHYSFILGNCTDLTGFPASGKTEFALEIMFYLSETFGLRHALYVPDMGNYKEIRRKLLHKYTGKTVNNKYSNYIQEHEILQANQWLDHHFIILQKKDSKKPVTPMDFWNFVATHKDNNGCIHTGLLDSWKNLFHDFQSREDLYLDYQLSYRNELAESENKHFFTIAHASKTEVLSGEKKRRIPDANDIKGGSSFFSSGKVIATVDYPDKTATGTDIYFSKIKPDTVGKSGAVIDIMRFDWERSRYYELEPNYMNKRYYAGELAKEKPRVNPLMNFSEPIKDQFEPPPF